MVGIIDVCGWARFTSISVRVPEVRKVAGLAGSGGGIPVIWGIAGNTLVVEGQIGTCGWANASSLAGIIDCGCWASNTGFGISVPESWSITGNALIVGIDIWMFSWANALSRV